MTFFAEFNSLNLLSIELLQADSVYHTYVHTNVSKEKTRAFETSSKRMASKRDVTFEQ